MLWVLPLVAGVVVVVVVVALAAIRRELAQSVIESQLRALGFEHVTHEVESFGPSRMGVRNLRFGQNDDFVVDEIEARYSLPNLRIGRIDSIAIRGVHLRARMDDDGLSLGVLDPLLDSENSDDTATAPDFALPVAHVSIEGISIALETDQGLLESTGSLAAHASENGSIELEFALAATHPQIGPDSPLEITGKATANANEIRFDFTAANKLRELVMIGSGHHDFATASGELQFDTDPLEFRSGGLQPVALIPQVKGMIETASGSIEAKGSIHWGAGEDLRSQLDIALRDLSVTSIQGSIENLNAAIRVEGPWPPSTPAKQLLSMAQIDFGLQLQNGLIAFQLRPDGMLDVSSAEWTLAGGKVRTRGRIDPTAMSQSLVLDLTDLELSELLELVDLSGLSGSGQLRGRIPIRRRGTTVEIRDGQLSATPAGGWIRYQPNAGVAGIANQGQGFDVLLAALRNFHFRELSASIDGDTEGPVNVAIHLAGANPDYLSGHPVEFNLNVEAHLVDLLRNATAVYKIPQQIEDRLAEISGAGP